MEVVMPKWGVTMQEGRLAEWLVAEGETVTEEQPLAHVVTDKVDAEIEAPISGVLTTRCVDAGDVVPVGVAVAVIEPQ